MEEHSQEHKDNKAKNTREQKKYKQVLKVFLLCLLSVLLLGYFALTYFSLNRTLPLLNIMGNDVGLKRSEQLNNFLKLISEANSSRIIKISHQGQVVEKTAGELGISIDLVNTSRTALDFGRYQELFPNFTYFNAVATNQTKIRPTFLWEGASFEKILSEIPENSKQFENAKFSVDDNVVNVKSEMSGWKIDSEALIDDIENCLSFVCDQPIKTSTQTTKPEIDSNQLSPYLAKVSSTADKGLTLLAKEKYKKYKTEKIDLISFINIKQTIEDQDIRWDETAIEQYLKNNIAKSINVSGKKKKISTYDNAVISEGTQGYGLQIDKSREAVKTALSKGTGEAILSIGVTPVETEYVNPGFTTNRVPGKYIDVNLSEQRLYTLEGDKLINSYRVSTGKWSMPTPIGQFAINSKNENAYSKTYNLYMPYWMAFIGHEYGIHELPETPSGRKEGESSLGVPVSHGCVRLGVGAAAEVYGWAEIGTPVFIHK